MPLMTWSEQYSVKVKKFDDDHKHLFAMVNDLSDAMRAGKGREVVAHVLAGLITYTVQHFAAEEAAMKRTRFPGYLVHADEHRLLTTEVQKLMREYESGNSLVTVELLCFLRDWLDRHVLTSDNKYAAHLNANGIA